MEKRIIRADNRVLKTKHSVSAMRKAGLVPGVLYGKKIGSIPIQVTEKDLSGMGGAHMVEVTLPGGSYPALIREVQKHPVNRVVRHVDFQVLELNKPVRTQMPVLLEGTPAGFAHGGILQMGDRTVEIEALPKDIPDVIKADISNLGIGDRYTVADLQKTTPHKIISDLHTVLAVVVAARAVPEEKPLAVEEKVTEGEEAE